MNDAEPDFEQLVTAMRAGEDDAFSWFWNRFGQSLQGIADKQLSAKIQRRVGADDIVQSACRTFFRRVTDGQFTLPDADALWRVLCTITLTKARRAGRDQNRQKRSPSREVYIEPGDDREPVSAASDSDAALTVQMADQLELLLGELKPEECQIVDLKLQHFTNIEIAEQMECSERTVRRLFQRIESRWQSMLAE